MALGLFMPRGILNIPLLRLPSRFCPLPERFVEKPREGS